MPRLAQPRAPVNQDQPAIPGYRILRLLDQGGMGVVYQARQESPDRVVALKVIRPDRRAHPEAVKRFEREARVAARLTHPNVVRVHHAGRAGSLHYLVMEYVEGIDLARQVGRHGPLPIALAIDYLRQAALGLQHLMDSGLVHRDIKPSNLLLQTASPLQISDCRSQIEKTPVPESAICNLKSAMAVVKIVDLGLARHFHPGEDSSITQGGMVGTPDYIAPEQAENPHQVDIRSDLYSLGCTLYFLLTGRPPFPDGTMIQKLDLHRWGTPAPLQRLRSDVPPELGMTAARLLAKKPADRFQTPAELAEALQQLLGAAPQSATVMPPPAKTHIDDRGTTQVRAAPLAVGASGLWLRGHTAAVASVAFSPDGRYGLSGSLDESIRLWDLATGGEVRSFPGHPGGVTAVAFSPDGQTIVSAGRDRLLRLQHLDGSARVLPGHTGEVHALALSPDGRRAISAGQDQTVRYWDLRKGKELRRIGGTVTERHWDAVLCVSLASRGRQPPEESFNPLALSGGRDGTARLWDLSTGRQLYCFRGHHAAVMAVDLSPDGSLALTAAAMTIRLWDTAAGELAKMLAGHTLPILAARFMPDGQHILSAGQDGTIRLCEVASGMEVRRLEAHAGWVLALASSPDGRHVLSGATDGSVCLHAVA